MNFKKIALLLRGGAIGVIPTDTIYGICASALDKKAVQEVYKLRRRNPQKPMIILISSLKDINKFDIDLKPWQKRILQRIWPGKISVVLKCASDKFFYLHRGTKTLAFRFPKKRELLKILKLSGPIIAPSANLEGHEPAQSIIQARKYFKNSVFYYGKGNLFGKPSTLIDLTRKTKKIKVLRVGADYKKVQIER
ncbi:MAG: L-threonylcarbamoyladenylate synthase [Candidatus Jorgensenbacteria bacterium]|nr:L-threonylcarbamoyladenylate synthase [Candidatus Jorgensenbacteria bacterium]